VDLAKEKGVFAMFDKNKYLQSGFMKSMPDGIKKRIRRQGIRNALILTEAPTGKISLLAGVSSGIEPIFSFSYIQKDRLGERTMYHSLYQEWVDKNGQKDIPDYFVVADDLMPEEHIKIQALIQKYTDSSISKTVNAPEVHTVEEVKKLYEMAYETGCKGVSYMREGSREGTLVRNKKEVRTEAKNGEVREEIRVWERPVKIQGATYRLKTPVGTAFITVNHDEFGAPVEVFINIGRAGSDIQAMAEALGRIISKSLNFGSHLSLRERAVLIIEQLRGIGGSRSVGFGAEKISSLPDAVAKALVLDMGLLPVGKSADKLVGENGKDDKIGEAKQLIVDDADGLKQLELLVRPADICPACGNAALVHEMGCKTCHGCGYSEC
jgi:ribonucleoside-diphosphate reductase alpha chain